MKQKSGNSTVQSQKRSATACKLKHRHDLKTFQQDLSQSSPIIVVHQPSKSAQNPPCLWSPEQLWPAINCSNDFQSSDQSRDIVIHNFIQWFVYVYFYVYVYVYIHVVL